MDWQQPEPAAQTTLREQPATRPEPPAEQENEALPTEVAPLAPAPAPAPTWGDVERRQHWDRILTADPETIPADIQKAAVGADAAATQEEREYRLLNTVNRSWVADTLQLSREKVSAAWADIRADLAHRLGVNDDEREIFTELSLRHQDAPLREQARRTFEQEYTRCLEGRSETDAGPDAALASPQNDRLREIRNMARMTAENDREESLRHAESLELLMHTFARLERGPVEQARALWDSPEVLEALDELAAMGQEKRARLYRVMQAEWRRNAPEPQTESLPVTMLHSMVRSSVNHGLEMAQGLGNVAVAQIEQLGRYLGSESLQNFADRQDERLRVWEELRRVAQQEVFPLNLRRDASFAEELLVDAAGAVPGVGLAFAGIPGISALAVSSAGASVSEARQKAPEGDQRLQTAAGCLAGAAQAAIFKGMSRLGQRLMGRMFSEFSGKTGSGIGKYALSALKSAAWFTHENINLLLAGKLAQLSEMGLQELAAQADDTASHIDWKRYGDNLTDIETNIREAARNLPFILIAGGRAALHHFRSPRSVIGDGTLLDEWGVSPQQKERVMNCSDVQSCNKYLREALRSSKRWSGAGFLEEFAGRSLRLLHSRDFHLFDNERTVRRFLELPADSSLPEKSDGMPAAPTAEQILRLQMTEPHASADNRVNPRKVSWVFPLMYEWYVKSGLQAERGGGAESAETRAPLRYFRSLPEELQQRGFYLPAAERVRRALLTELVRQTEQLSYRFLFNTYTAESLARRCFSRGEAVSRSEETRRRIPALVASSVLRCVMNGSHGGVIGWLQESMSKYYLHRRYNSARESWLKELSIERLQKCAMLTEVENIPPEVREMHRQCMELSGVVKNLYTLLPHLEDFRTLLSIGYSPRHAYAELLEREFGRKTLGKNWKPEGWIPYAEEHDTPDIHENTVRNQRQLQLYSLLTGCAPEQAVQADGKSIWCIRKPDGTYTRWHESEAHLANAVAFNYELNAHLPYNTSEYLDMVRLHAGRHGMHFPGLLPRERQTYTGHDALGIRALDDLSMLWMSDASRMQIGLDFTKRNFPRFHLSVKSDGVDPVLYVRAPGGPHHFGLDIRRTMHPLHLVQARALVYWRRMLDSGWVDLHDAADFLTEQGALDPAEKDKLLQRLNSRRLLIDTKEGKPLSRRRLYRRIRLRREQLERAERSRVMQKLADKMAYFSTMLLVADMHNTDLPITIREWVGMAAFRPAARNVSRHRPEEIIRRTDNRLPGKRARYFLSRWSNAQASDFLRSGGEQIGRIREQLADASSPLVTSPLYPMVRELWKLPEAQRREQMWSYLLYGENGLRGTGQHHWNLLRKPLYGWYFLPQEWKLNLTPEIIPVIRRYPAPGVDPDAKTAVEESLLSLQALLEEMPQLRDYEINLLRPGHFRKLIPDAPLPAVGPYDITEASPERLTRVEKPEFSAGGRMEDAELPPEWAADARVLPALHLLSALRCHVASSPRLTPEGIFWKGERYGGMDGRVPNRLRDGWRPSRPLDELLRMLQSIEDRAAGGSYRLAGEVFAPLNTEVSMAPLQHATVYRHPSYPDVQVRFMPGEVGDTLIARRTPHIVHLLAGAPLTTRNGWHKKLKLSRIYQSPVRFDSDMKRYSHYEQGHRTADFRDMIFNELADRLSDPEKLRLGKTAELSNAELLLHLAQDTQFSDSLRDVDAAELTPAEVRAVLLFRSLLAYEYGADPSAAEAELMKLGERFRAAPALWEQLRATLREPREKVLRKFRSKYPGRIYDCVESVLPPPPRRRERPVRPRRQWQDDSEAREYMRNISNPGKKAADETTL